MMWILMLYRMEEGKKQTTSDDPVEDEDFGPIKVRDIWIMQT